MSVAPDLPPVVRIPSRAARGRPTTTRRPLRLVPPATRPITRTSIAAPARPARPGTRADPRPGRRETRPTFFSASAPTIRQCVEAEPIVPEAWLEPAADQALEHDWDAFVEESLALGPATTRRPATAPRTAGIPAVRLTRRGRAALAAAAAVVAAVLVLLAVVGASGEPAQRHPSTPASVVVADGDTLWTIAQRVAPTVDPRREVATLMRLNHLRAVAVVPGQVIRTR
jgi:LysM repeat protein